MWESLQFVGCARQGSDSEVVKFVAVLFAEVVTGSAGEVALVGLVCSGRGGRTVGLGGRYTALAAAHTVMAV